MEAARQAGALRRLAEELAPADFAGELRVLQSFPDQPTRLVLISTGSAPGSVEMPRAWLYSEISETELRASLAKLMDRSAQRAGPV